MNSLSVMRRRMAAWAVLCGATAALLGMNPAAAQTLRPDTDLVPGVQLRTGETLRVTGYAALRAKALQSPRKVRVIARLSALATGDGVSAEPLRALGETPAIRVARDQLVLRLRARGAEAVAGLPDTALVVMEVDAAQLDALVANGEVAELTEDVPVPTTLADSGPLVRAPQAQALGARGAGTTVAILDTGVQSNHPFLTGRVVEEACFSTTSAANNSTSVCPGGASSSTAAGSGAACAISGCDHGTHVAGIAAGRASGATTFNGMAPDASIMAVQVFSRFTDSPGNTPCASQGKASPCILSFTSDQIRGLQRVLERVAARNIVAANMSLGGGVNAAACDADARKDVIDDLLAARVATVIASGNNGASTGVSAPGCISTAVTVGSTTKTDGISSFSNSSTLVDILAPGSSINSSVTGGGFGVKSGTSMATPHVVGAFAAIRSMVPGANVNDILGALQSTGVAITDSRNGVTRRRINIEAAVNQLAPQPFALSAGMLFQMHANGRIWAHTGVACSGTACPGWVLLDANPATRAIAAGGNALYQLHADGKIWRYTGIRCGGASCPGWQMLDNNPATKQIAAGGTALYQRHADGKIWRSTGAACSGNSCPGWTMLDNNPAAIDIVADGTRLYQLHNTGAIWRSTGAACSGNSCPGWTMLDKNAHTKALAAAGGQLFQLHDTGAIWRSTGVVCSGNSCPGWTMLDNNPAAREIAANVGGLFQRHADGKIWRSTGAACSGNSCPGWTMLDNNGATVQIEATASGLFQRHSNGRIWRSTGAACSGSSCPGWVMLDNNPATSTIVTAQP
ncbi:S8 family peptidase [Roseateles chitinivorans]|uniref:S8 family peptidase n=1 Tax=Roseateles chitinivorans TaxID=2917965 RepID=UPI003D6682F7